MLSLGTILLTCNQQEEKNAATIKPDTTTSINKHMPAEDSPQNLPSGEKTPVDAHNTQNSVDWDGTYKGVIPCDDCGGIDIVLKLNSDYTYGLDARYRDKTPVKKYSSKGKFSFDKTGSKIILEGMADAPVGIYNKLMVGENVAWMLDATGTRVGARAYNSFALQKQ